VLERKNAVSMKKHKRITIVETLKKREGVDCGALVWRKVVLGDNINYTRDSRSAGWRPLMGELFVATSRQLVLIGMNCEKKYLSSIGI
jgi:hypothetical protein